MSTNDPQTTIEIRYEYSPTALIGETFPVTVSISQISLEASKQEEQSSATKLWYEIQYDQSLWMIQGKRKSTVSLWDGSSSSNNNSCSGKFLFGLCAIKLGVLYLPSVSLSLNSSPASEASDVQV